MNTIKTNDEGSAQTPKQISQPKATLADVVVFPAEPTWPGMWAAMPMGNSETKWRKGRAAAIGEAMNIVKTTGGKIYIKEPGGKAEVLPLLSELAQREGK